MNHHLTIGCYVGLLRETGARMTEGLRITWPQINLFRKILTLEGTKSGRVRHIPLSPFACELLEILRKRRVLGTDRVFLQENGKPWTDPRGPFFLGRQDANLGWVGFHDLRHFRATQWVMGGMDLRTVQHLLGHASLTTTMRYAHFAPSHAEEEVLRVAKREAEKMDGNWTEAAG